MCLSHTHTYIHLAVKNGSGSELAIFEHWVARKSFECVGLWDGERAHGHNRVHQFGLIRLWDHYDERR